MNEEIPEHIKSSYTYYKQQYQVYCQNCKEKNAKFVSIRIKKHDLICWIFNCTECGEDFEITLPYKKLRSIAVQYFYKKDKETIRLFELWEMWKLGMFYRQVFKHPQDATNYNKILIRLKKETAGWRRYWMMICN